ncbi:MAG TPA: DUF3800 domain-containing protein [Pyrinomonadaceae bacterium]|jgi:hypothetical protein|nr:DUF3800 domain-containing protein [Pyrinomonadaceae bacterium]
MLQAYVDESGTHDASRHYIVAGYISTADEWEKFDEEWAGVLDDYGLKSFHMVEFKSRFVRRKSQYRHIDKPDGDRMLDRLANVLSRRVLTGVAGVLPMDAYNQVVKGRYEKYLGRPYTLCTNIMLMAVGLWAKEVDYSAKFQEPITFFFERGAQHKGELEKAFREAAELPEFKERGWLGPQTFVPKGGGRGLEAADLLAHAVHSEMRGQVEDMPPQRILSGIEKTPLKILGIDERGLLIATLMRII